jgi:hypothetical protein
LYSLISGDHKLRRNPGIRFASRTREANYSSAWYAFLIFNYFLSVIDLAIGNHASLYLLSQAYLRLVQVFL